MHVGSHITFAAQDTQIVATVVALTKADGQHAYSRAEFILPAAPLAGLPMVWYGGVHVDPARVGDVQRALYRAYPTVTVINVAQALETVRAVVIQITYVIQFLAAFSIFAGIIILASSIAGTRYRRIREVVVLKTLGATRRADCYGVFDRVCGAGVGGWDCGDRVCQCHCADAADTDEVAYHFHWMWTAAGLAGTAALTVVTGWVASHRILGRSRWKFCARSRRFEGVFARDCSF